MSNKEFIADFIEVYRQHPALWKIKSPQYINKNLKKAGYTALIEVCKKYKINGTEDMVKKKIQSLRSTFRKEYNKQQKSIRSGSGTDDIYSPNLWYFDLLMFIKDQEEATGSISNISSPVLSEDDVNTNDLDDEENIGESNIEENGIESQEVGQEVENVDKTQNEEVNSQISSQSTPRSSNNASVNTAFITKDRQARKKQKKDDVVEQRDFLKVCTNALVNAANNEVSDASTAFGTYVGTKLKTVTDASQKMYAEMLITQILQRAVMNKLSENTVLIDQTPLTPAPFHTFSREAQTSSDNTTNRMLSNVLHNMPSTDSEYSSAGQFYSTFENL